MGNIFKPYNQGDAFSPSAAQLNSWIAAAKRATVGGDLRGKPTTNFDPAGYLWCWVKNTTGALREQYDVVSLRGVVVRAGENGSDYKDRPYYKAIAPDPAIRPAVFLEPCPAGQIRRAAIMGLVPCRIDATSEGVARAEIVAGQYHLAGGTAGYEIVDLDAGDEEDEEWEFEPGIKVGIVQIGGGGGDQIKTGSLTVDIPANTIVDAAVTLTDFDAEGTLVDLGEDPIAARTIASYSLLQGSLFGTPIPVFGVVKTFTKTVEDEPVSYRCFFILGPYFESIAIEGAEVAPSNGVGQIVTHRHNEKKTVAEAQPCGGS